MVSRLDFPCLFSICSGTDFQTIVWPGMDRRWWAVLLVVAVGVGDGGRGVCAGWRTGSVVWR